MEGEVNILFKIIRLVILSPFLLLLSIALIFQSLFENDYNNFKVELKSLSTLWWD